MVAKLQPRELIFTGSGKAASNRRCFTRSGWPTTRWYTHETGLPTALMRGRPGLALSHLLLNNVYGLYSLEAGSGLIA